MRRVRHLPQEIYRQPCSNQPQRDLFPGPALFLGIRPRLRQCPSDLNDAIAKAARAQIQHRGMKKIFYRCAL